MEKITSKKYLKIHDNHIIEEGLQFQIDNYYEPKEGSMKRRIEIVMKAIDPKSGERILDIGCGVGTFAFHCAKFKAVTFGIDYSKESIKVARILAEKYGVGQNINYIVGNATELPFRDFYFDKVVVADFIEHISFEEKEKLMREICRVPKPEGSIIIFTPNGIREKIGEIYWRLRHFLLGDKIPISELHFGLTNKFEFENLLKKNKLNFKLFYEDITHPYLAHWPFLRIFLSLNLLWIVKKKVSSSRVTNICVLCNGHNAQVIENYNGYYKVLKCLNCGLVYVNPIPQKELLEKNYSQEYYTPWLENQREKRIIMWRLRLKTLNGFSNKKGKLLDVGCGEGLFLELTKKDGWDVTGTEISPFAVTYGKEKLGLNILQGELMDIGLPDKTFDAITMWHVLEHTTNPVAVLKEIRRILKDDGVFILAIPNLNNVFSQWAYRLAKGRRMHLFDPEDRELHLYYFTPATIRLALEKAGFRVNRIIPDMGIVQWHIRILNHIAKVFSLFIGRIITDALEVYAISS